MEVLRYVTDVTCKAHGGDAALPAGLREYQTESLFQHFVYEQGGRRNCAYTCICATVPTRRSCTTAIAARPTHD